MEALRAANRGMARAVCQGAKTAKRYAALGAGMEVDAQGYGREPTAMVRGVLSCLFVCLFVPKINEAGKIADVVKKGEEAKEGFFFGDGSFMHWNEFIISDCSVKTVMIGTDCFLRCEYAVFNGWLLIEYDYE